MFVRRAFKKCAQESSNKFEMYDGGRQREWEERAHPWCKRLLFGECILRLWAPTDRKYAGHLICEGPKVTISGAFISKQP